MILSTCWSSNLLCGARLPSTSRDIAELLIPRTRLISTSGRPRCLHTRAARRRTATTSRRRLRPNSSTSSAAMISSGGTEKPRGRAGKFSATTPYPTPPAVATGLVTSRGAPLSQRNQERHASASDGKSLSSFRSEARASTSRANASRPSRSVERVNVDTRKSEKVNTVPESFLPESPVGLATLGSGAGGLVIAGLLLGHAGTVAGMVNSCVDYLEEK